MQRFTFLLLLVCQLSGVDAWGVDPPKRRVDRFFDQAATKLQHAIGTALVTASVLLFPLQEVHAEDQSVVQEVWTLVDKYYIDRTFGGQDWQAVLKKYSAKKGDETKIVTEMVQSLGDKYSRILDPAQYTAIQKFDLIGVGATLIPNADKKLMLGAPPVAGSAADQAGLRTGDLVRAVNGVPTDGRTAFDIIDQIADNPNAAEVTFSIRTVDGVEREVVLDRKFAEVKNPVQYKLTERRPDGTNVGFIKVAEFNSLVKAKLEDALKDLRAQGANAFVLDLRMNTGGAFQSAVEISGLFVEDRVATYGRSSRASLSWASDPLSLCISRRQRERGVAVPYHQGQACHCTL